MHWEINGTSAEYGEKWMLLPLGAVSILMTALLWIVPKIDPRKENYRRFENAYFSICVLLNVFFMAVMGMVLTESLYPGRVPVPKAVSALCALLFILIGNLMPKIKSNFSTGFKTPWALSSEEVWNKTQRLGGRLFYTGRTGDFGGMLFRGRKRAVCGNDGNRICDSSFAHCHVLALVPAGTGREAGMMYFFRMYLAEDIDALFGNRYN